MSETNMFYNTIFPLVINQTYRTSKINLLWTSSSKQLVQLGLHWPIELIECSHREFTNNLFSNQCTDSKYNIYY